MKTHQLTKHATTEERSKEVKNLNFIAINVILELLRKYYLSDI